LAPPRRAASSRRASSGPVLAPSSAALRAGGLSAHPPPAPEVALPPASAAARGQWLPHAPQRTAAHRQTRGGRRGTTCPCGREGEEGPGGCARTMYFSPGLHAPGLSLQAQRCAWKGRSAATLPSSCWPSRTDPGVMQLLLLGLPRASPAGVLPGALDRRRESVSVPAVRRQ